jgi:uncharacterized protein YoxC
MLATSKDVLNLLLGFSVVLVAIVFSWVLYQIGKTLKGVNETVKVTKNIAHNIDEAVANFKNRAGDVAAYMTVLAKGGQEIFQIIRNHTGHKGKKKSDKK